jgi:DNA-binding response OmpR family regulator
MMQAIVVSSNGNERDLLTHVLRQAGVAVASSADYKRVLSNWEDHPADVLVVAIDQTSNPVEITKAVRLSSQVQLLVICDSITENDLINALNEGADIILTRPVSPLVFSAQATAMMRRANVVPAYVLPTLNLDAIMLDPSTRTVTVQGMEPQKLTQLEFRLLYALMLNRGQVLPTEVIVEKVWGYTSEGNRELVRGLVSRLRHKIEPDPENPVFLETHTGIGYRFIVNEM